MRIARLGIILLCTAVSAHAGLFGGPERAVSTPADIIAEETDIAATATDGRDFLTVWHDQYGRDGIYATIVREIRVFTPNLASPQLLRGVRSLGAVWTGDSYLLVAAKDGALLTLRLNRDGKLIAPAVRVDGFDASEVFDVAWNGSRALAIVTRASGIASAVPLDANGRAAGDAIPLSTNITRSATVAAAGDAFIVARAEVLGLRDDGNFEPIRVVASRLSPDGQISAPIELMPLETARMGSHALDSAVAGNDVGISVFRERFLGGINLSSRYQIDATTLAVNLRPFVGGLVFDSRIVLTPAGFATVAFSGSDDGFYLHVSQFDSAAQRSFPINGGRADSVEVESNGRVVLIAFGGYPVARLFESSLTSRHALDGVPGVFAPAKRQNLPSVVAGGGGALVTWVEPSRYSNDILYARWYDSSGNPRGEPHGFASPIDQKDPPAATFTGQLWLVAADGRIHRFAENDPQILELPAIDGIPFEAPAFASNGTVTAFVYQNASRIYLVRFAPDGTRIDTAPIVVSNETERAYAPAVATNGHEFLVTWTHVQVGFEGPQSPTHIHGARLSENGSVIDPAPIEITNGAWDDRASRVASNGADFVVAYEHAAQTKEIRAKRVLRNGTLADTTAAQAGFFLGEGIRPDIAARGDHYVVTFTDETEAKVAWHWMFAVPADARGEAMAEPVAIVRGESYVPAHGIAAVGDAIWSVYSRAVDELTGVDRVFVRTVNDAPPRRRGVRR